MMVEDRQHKTISELEMIRCNYLKDVEQLTEICSRLHKGRSMLSQMNDNRHVDTLVNLTADSIVMAEDTLHKLLAVTAGVEELLQLYRAYLEVKF